MSQVHSCNTHFAAKQAYHFPSIRTNYGTFNIRFEGPKVHVEIKISTNLVYNKSVINSKIVDTAVIIYLNYQK